VRGLRARAQQQVEPEDVLATVKAYLS